MVGLACFPVVGDETSCAIYQCELYCSHVLCSEEHT
jgi:hypothetical protein